MSATHGNGGFGCIDHASGGITVYDDGNPAAWIHCENPQTARL